ncbi:hypothetical protein J0X19_22055 [Hymenobacter sp. BT186]|uniref:Uncharacterized protein n=1 Tax=Hymenobacter telluris TaxID=2816474 RepID=A0A939F025_9BACT|nr:hypothetical protein [Hymenobacter telluris]MBO0360660.1 hypothetical protein [Hymenobacter telluris]MBW3376687.1 hypothetical protein [Hymenobacter norwichensis]
MESPIHFYTAAAPDSQLHAFARETSARLHRPVLVHPYAELPAPDLQRPTRQQLRAERAALQPMLTSLNENIRLVEDAPHLPHDYLQDLATLHHMRERYEQRLACIEHLLTAPAGPAPSSPPTR